MRLRFLVVISAIKNHRNSNMYDSQPGVGIRIQEPETKSQKGAPKIGQFVIFHVYNMWP